VAQDTGGETAAGPWYDRAQAAYTTLIDVKHTISSLYGMVNVPTGVWIDEKGRIVRPNEVAYSRDVGFLGISVKGSQYVAALRDWVEKGAASAYALKPEDVAQRLPKRTEAQDLAEAHFKLGLYFHFKGLAALADQHWEAAQKLNPESWNYHRQDWAFTPDQAGANWMAKYRDLGDKPYYAPLELEPQRP